MHLSARTESAIAAAREYGVLAVEMEAAGLYAFATSRMKPVICFAHVTNSMGQTEGDFEKGEADGVVASLRVVAATARAWTPRARWPTRDAQTGPGTRSTRGPLTRALGL